MTIYERFDFITGKIDEMISEDTAKMVQAESEHITTDDYYYMGRVHALREIRMVIMHQIAQHQIDEDMDLVLDALTRRMV